MTGEPGRGSRDGNPGGDDPRAGGAGESGRRPALDDVFRPRAARVVTGTLGVVVALADRKSVV